MNYFNKDINFNPIKDSFKKIPNSPGIYMLCLKNGASLPSTDINPIYNQFHGLDILYNGITEKSLQTRDYKNHFVGNNAGRSTLRKSIGSIILNPWIGDP